MATDVQTPRLVNGKLLLLAGLSERFDDETVQRIPQLWQRFGPHIGAVPGQIGDTTYGVIYNNRDDGFDYAAAVEVDRLDRLPHELTGLRIPPETYAVFTHAGHISTFRTTMNAVWNEWISAAKLMTIPAPQLERYDERFDAQSGNGEIEIWIPIERA